MPKIGDLAANAAWLKKMKGYRSTFWPGEVPWLGADRQSGERAWMSAPRSITLVLNLIDRLGGDLAPSFVYLELLARHRGQGVVEIVDEFEIAYACGYESARRDRTWRERMGKLNELGFIRGQEVDGKPYGLVYLVHPTVAIQRLHEKNLLPASWWATYRKRQIANNERSYDDLMEELGVDTTPQGEVEKVVPIVRS
jgi:hypothetical protein